MRPELRRVPDAADYRRSVTLEEPPGGDRPRADDPTEPVTWPAGRDPVAPAGVRVRMMNRLQLPDLSSKLRSSFRSPSGIPTAKIRLGSHALRYLRSGGLAW